MGAISKKLIELAIRKGNKAAEINPSNPLTQDTASFLIRVAKGVIDIL